MLDAWWPYVGTFGFVSGQVKDEGTGGWYYSSYKILTQGDEQGYTDKSLDETFKCINAVGTSKFKNSVLYAGQKGAEGGCEKKHGFLEVVKRFFKGVSPVCKVGGDDCKPVEGPKRCNGQCACEDSNYPLILNKCKCHAKKDQGAQLRDQKVFEEYFGKPKSGGWARITTEYDGMVTKKKEKYTKAVKDSGAKSWATATREQRGKINAAMGGKFAMNIMNMGEKVTSHYKVYTGRQMQVHSHTGPDH